MPNNVIIRDHLLQEYADVYTDRSLSVLSSFVVFNEEIKTLMAARMARRLERQQKKEVLAFTDPESIIPGTDILVKDARLGKFEGAIIPKDLQRQWIQGTGPAAKPYAPIERSIRNIAYALLSGADGWMFDGEDALGQVAAMSLDNQRNLKLAISEDPLFMKVAAGVAPEMNKWASGFWAVPS